MKVLILATFLFFSGCISDTPTKFDKVAPNVYVYHGPTQEPNVENKGFMNNPALIVGKSGLIVVDPGGTYRVGKMILEEIEKISDKEIVAVFNTHIHGDHWLANQAIAEKYPNVKIYANKEMIKRAKDGRGQFWINLMLKSTKGLSRGTKLVYPNSGVAHKEKVIAGGEEFIIHIPEKSAHTNTDILIEYQKSKTIFLGDNDFLSRIGRFDDSSSMIGNIRLLKYVQQLDIDIYVPGHGQSGDEDKSLKPFLNYLKIIKSEMQKAYDDDKASFEVKGEISKKLATYHKWNGYEENFGKHLGKMILEIEALDL